MPTRWTQAGQFGPTRSVGPHEARGRHPPLADHEADAIRADYVLTENGGLHGGTNEAPTLVINVAEKG